jgi:hypothetical protein
MSQMSGSEELLISHFLLIYCEFLDLKWMILIEFVKIYPFQLKNAKFESRNFTVRKIYMALDGKGT